MPSINNDLPKQEIFIAKSDNEVLLLLYGEHVDKWELHKNYEFKAVKSRLFDNQYYLASTQNLTNNVIRVINVAETIIQGSDKRLTLNTENISTITCLRHDIVFI